MCCKVYINNMNINNAYWQVAETKEDFEELKLNASKMTLDEIALHYGMSKSKMYHVLRCYDLKAKAKERPKKIKEEKLPKKDHELTRWASYTNKGKIRYVYYNMLKRCYDSTRREYYCYGGRGIKVCDDWKSDCCIFYKWARENGYKEGLQLDRIDNNGNYCPENCRWVTAKENSNNRRNNRKITYKGKVKSLSEWANELNIPYSILADRIYKYKWSIERAMTEPYIAK